MRTSARCPQWKVGAAARCGIGLVGGDPIRAWVSFYAVSAAGANLTTLSAAFDLPAKMLSR